MGKGGKKLENGHTKLLTWDEIQTHDKKDDCWIVVHGKVYNVTNFMRKHPGGARIISSFGGHDATDVWVAMHNNKSYVTKFMDVLYLGELQTDKEETEIDKDFRELRQYVEDEKLLTASPIFYILQLLFSVLGMDVLGYLILLKFGTTWLPYILACLCFMTAQAQCGWLQHDFGHLSVFRNRKVNHIAQQLLIGQVKGASRHWWNFRHSLHHAKPNVLKKDPDIELEMFFVLGDVLPKIFGREKQGFMPYNLQHIYIFLLTPFLMPVYFFYDNWFFVYKRKDYVDLFWMLTFYVKLFVTLGPIFGLWGAFWTFMFVRMLESHWFVWCTQMSHIPMEVDFDSQKDWVHLQLESTCNVEHSTFTDWFSGHLNYQIEHHLFPTMPRHNFIKIAPLVRSLCKKHDVHYRIKPLMEAFGDVVRALSHSGKVWYEAYNS